MGREHDCRATLNGKGSNGRALLETEEIIFRGADFRLRIPFKSIKKVSADDKALIVEYGSDKASFALGEHAKKWADAIKNPKSRVDKLGIKAGQKIALINIDDEALAAELEAKGATIGKTSLDAIFFGANDKKELKKLASLREKIASNGAIWIVRPKGVDTISEKDVMSSAKAAGLVDVKVVKLSETHTAEKVVIPVSKRGKL
jgi:hypothetical protein